MTKPIWIVDVEAWRTDRLGRPEYDAGGRRVVERWRWRRELGHPADFDAGKIEHGLWTVRTFKTRREAEAECATLNANCSQWKNYDANLSSALARGLDVAQIIDCLSEAVFESSEALRREFPRRGLDGWAGPDARRRVWGLVGVLRYQRGALSQLRDCITLPLAA